MYFILLRAPLAPAHAQVRSPPALDPVAFEPADAHPPHVGRAAGVLALLGQPLVDLGLQRTLALIEHPPNGRQVL
jgi:hypothetical protein